MADSQSDRGTPLASLTPLRPADARALEVLAPVVRLGQSPQNEIVIDDDTVSTHHARLEYQAGAWQLTDLESRNGTYIEGNRLAAGVATPLADGALVGIGAVKLRFHQGGGVDLERARAEYTAPPEAPRLAQRAGFRLPLWIVLLILVLIGIVIGLFFWMQGATPAPEPIVQPSITLLLPGG